MHEGHSADVHWLVGFLADDMAIFVRYPGPFAGDTCPSGELQTWRAWQPESGQSSTGIKSDAEEHQDGQSPWTDGGLARSIEHRRLPKLPSVRRRR